jgi:hypothetical protein
MYFNNKWNFIVALPRQQWLREHATMLRYTYIAFLVKILSVLWVSAFSKISASGKVLNLSLHDRKQGTGVTGRSEAAVQCRRSCFCTSYCRLLAVLNSWCNRQQNLKLSKPIRERLDEKHVYYRYRKIVTKHMNAISCITIINPLNWYK